MSFNIGDITEIFKRPKVDLPNFPSDSQANSGTNMEGFLASGDGTYSVEPQNWYSAKPYGFKINFRNNSSTVMFLPINPNNLSITTHFATNVISTLYGTVEEHSDVRYFDIVIQGTTGIAPRFIAPSQLTQKSSGGNAYSETKKSGRSTFSIADSMNAGGFFAKSLNAINQIKNKAADILDGGSKPKTGLVSDNSGYVAFHNLYRVLLKYKKDAAGSDGTVNRKQHPLTFFNYKDNNQYDVAVRGFTMTRSVDNPMLYNYSIQLRGYNLRNIGDKIDEDLTKRLQDLGLNGVDGSSVLGDMKSLAGQAKSIIGSAVGGINILGR